MIKKTILSSAIILAFTYSNTFANNNNQKAAFVNSSNKMFNETQKINLSVDSAGARYIKNVLKKDGKLEKITVKELYTKKVSSDWNGGIFDVAVESLNGGKKNSLVKLFYNSGGLIVLDIFTTDGRSMIKQLVLPLHTEIAYNKEFNIFKRDENKKSPKGRNMVIFSDPQCPFCADKVPLMLDFAKKYNINVYYYDIPLEIPSHANSKNIILCTHAAIAKNKKDAIKIIENVYDYDFGQTKKSIDKILIEFNKISGVSAITKGDLKRQASQKHLDESITIVKKLHVEETPTVYVDGKQL